MENIEEILIIRNSTVINECEEITNFYKIFYFLLAMSIFFLGDFYIYKFLNIAIFKNIIPKMLLV